MSSELSAKKKISEFIERFIEACGTSKPAEIQRLLNISYQAAKNYLNGRIPDSSVMQTIAERTPFSIHWLLTGKGEKLVSLQQPIDTPILTGQIRALVREECVEVINEILVNPKEPAPHRIVVLQSDKLSSEKVYETTTSSENSDLIPKN